MDAQQKEELNKLETSLKQAGFSSICFWLPTRSVGGGTFLFCELVKYFLQNTNFKIYYLDCPDGYAHSLLEKHERLHMIDYNINDKDFPTKEPLLVFTNTTRAIQIKNMNPKSRFVFWHWETNPVGWDILYLLKEANRITNAMQKKKALVFHDWSSYHMLKTQLALRCDTPEYYPVFLPNNETEAKGHPIVSEKEINIAWVGRLSHDKFNSLNNIITCFAKYKTDKIKRFHIIGDGLCADKVKAFAKKYYDQIEFIFKGTIPHNELGAYLINNADILFAMGTAVLDGAALAIPSVVVTLSEKPYFDDDFYFLSDTKDYCVGITLSQKKDFDINYRKFKTVLDLIQSGDKEKIGKRCFDYFKNNYCSYYDRTKKLLELFKGSQFTFRTLKRIMRYIPYNQIQVKSYKLKRLNLVSFVRRTGCSSRVVLLNRLPLVPYWNAKREEPGIVKKGENLTVSVKNGYVFAAEIFKG